MNHPIGKISVLLGITFLAQAVESRPFSPTFCVAELRSTDRASKINFRQEPGLVYLVSQSSPEPDIKKDRSGKVA